jgi:multidrug efflux pump subunit AcrA (membrane-fusion protein)
MDQITDASKLKREPLHERAVVPPRRRTWRTAAIGVVTVLALFLAWFALGPHKANQAAAVPTLTLPVTVSQPLQHAVDSRAGFLGQFSAIDRVELRAQVGGTLTEIHFKDGDIVHKGDLLFVIDPRPYDTKSTSE